MFFAQKEKTDIKNGIAYKEGYQFDINSDWYSDGLYAAYLCGRKRKQDIINQIIFRGLIIDKQVQKYL
jgi:hypothetical protein